MPGKIVQDRACFLARAGEVEIVDVCLCCRLRDIAYRGFRHRRDRDVLAGKKSLQFIAMAEGSQQRLRVHRPEAIERAHRPVDDLHREGVACGQCRSKRRADLAGAEYADLERCHAT